MKAPEIAALPTAQWVENNANGAGYRYFLPDNPQPIEPGLEGLKQYGDFVELSKIVDAAQQHGAVLVQGAPGAGKSHLVRELEEGAAAYDVPFYCLTTHVNAGKASGIENMTESLTGFREAVGDNGGLIILDNIDYPGYKGSSRRRAASTKYAEDAQALVTNLIEDPRMRVVATAHNNEWRDSRWTWADPAIDGPASRILESFPVQMVFEGSMALVGLAHVLHERGVPLGTAARTIRALHMTGHANFFHANHLNAELFQTDPQAALDAIHAGRDERIGR